MMHRYDSLTGQRMKLFSDGKKRFFFNLLIMLVFIPTMASPTHKNRTIGCAHSDLFSYYGFSKPEQKKALMSLLSDTGIELPHGTDDVWLYTLIDLTQKKWVRRTHGQDRWQVPKDRILNPQRLLQNLKILGFVLPIRPNILKTDVLCILGARGPTMKERIQYAEKLISRGLKVGNIVLLAGERPVTVGVDGSEKMLMDLAQQRGLRHWKYLTETDLIQNIWNQSPLSRQNIPITTIDTPRGALPRPTTQTTMLELIAFLKKNPHIHHVTFISNQPHVAYQQTLIDSVLRLKGVTLSYQVVGQGANSTFSHALSILAELGSYLWAKTPDVLCRMAGRSKPFRTKAPSWQKLYSHNPLLYKTLPASLR
jgi:hypothetical protein